MIRLTRRAALLAAALPLAGCSVYDSWFGGEKPKLPGVRIPVMPAETGLAPDAGTPAVALPPEAPVADAPQAGGTPAHSGGNMQARPTLAAAWTSGIGAGTDYRDRLTAPPVVGGGRVFAMDADAVVTALDAGSGRQVWQAETRGPEDRSSNVGGGIALDGATLYAATGRADLVAFDAATGAVRWRTRLPTPARSSPTVAGGHIVVSTIDDQVVCFAEADGARQWSHQAPPAETSVLGLPAPTVASGLVVAGFSSGEVRALRLESGTNAWGDSLAARGRISMTDIAAIRGRSASADGQLYAGGLGGLLVAIDLRTGRRLWEREATLGEMPWIGGAWLFVVTTNGTVAALSRADGRVAWVAHLDPFEDMEKMRTPIVWYGPVLAGGRLYVAGSNAQMAVIDPVAGKRLGSIALSSGAAAAPVPAGGALYVLTADGSVTCLR